jgi:hypothetical protein
MLARRDGLPGQAQVKPGNDNKQQRTHRKDASILQQPDKLLAIDHSEFRSLCQCRAASRQ